MQAATDRPRFRQDLVAEAIEDGATRFIDVQDPDNGTLYRFFEVEYSLACAMDGQRDVAGIVRWADEELGLKTTAKEVGNVILTLIDLGYLERGAAVAAAAGQRPTPPAGIKKPPEQPALNRWDQPTAMGNADEYLERGVVHGGGRPATPAPDVELGKAGTRGGPGSEMPRAPHLELGAPGVRSPGRPAARAEDVPLGKPGRSDNIEVDLAADMPLSAAAVKEAVRESQVMKSVDAPRELVEAAKPAAKAAARVESKPVEKKPEPRVETSIKSPAVEKRPEPRPEPRPRTDSRVPQAPQRSVSPVLIAALIIVILGAGGFALYKFVFNKKETTTSAKPPPPPPKPVPPPPPAAETAKLALEQPPAEEVKPVAQGVVATIVANDTAVKEGEPIARFNGFKQAEAQVTMLDKALVKMREAVTAAEKERDAAQTAGNKNGVTAAEKKLATAQKAVTDQEAKIPTAKAAIDKFVVKSPAAGKVTAVAKPTAKVTPTDVIATLTRDPFLTATFKSAGQVAVGTHVLLQLKGSDQKLTCTVAQSGGDGIKISCPKDAAAEGADVSYAGVDPNAPPPGEPEVKPENAGSATPPGSGAGSAKPEDKGSAAKPDEPEDKPADKPAEQKKAPTPRPRPRPRPPKPPEDKGSGEGSDKPADKPGDTPPPAGSGAP